VLERPDNPGADKQKASPAVPDPFGRSLGGESPLRRLAVPTAGCQRYGEARRNIHGCPPYRHAGQKQLAHCLRCHPAKPDGLGQRGLDGFSRPVSARWSLAGICGLLASSTRDHGWRDGSTGLQQSAFFDPHFIGHPEHQAFFLSAKVGQL